MVNTYKKFPNDVKHNAYYAADGTDLRDATNEKIDKYRLGTAHKRRKRAVEAAHDKTEIKDPEARDERCDSSRSTKREVTKHKESPPPNRSEDVGSRDRGAKDESGRTSSRDSRKDRGHGDRSHSRTGVVQRESGGGRASHVSDRDKMEAGCLGELDEDESDRREMEEIRQSIKERKSQKALDMGPTSASVAATATSSATSTSVKESRKTSEMSKKSDETVTATRRATKKLSVSHTASSAADANQREEAIQWALGAALGTDVTKLGPSNKETTRPKPSKKTATEDVRTVGLRRVGDANRRSQTICNCRATPRVYCHTAIDQVESKGPGFHASP